MDGEDGGNEPRAQREPNDGHDERDEEPDRREQKTAESDERIAARIHDRRLSGRLGRGGGFLDTNRRHGDRLVHASLELKEKKKSVQKKLERKNSLLRRAV